jgi:DNA-binding MarR family transcriptional regulator
LATVTDEAATVMAAADDAAGNTGYVLDDQVGFLLRQVQQRHVSIFARHFGDDMTPMQWAALAKLAEVGECSQNLLGRHTAMDVATIKGVAERLAKRGLTETRPDPEDRRRLLISLSAEGARLYAELAPVAARVSEETLAPLSADERAKLARLLTALR